MLLTQLKKIMHIDDEIRDTQDQLSVLYEKRTELVGGEFLDELGANLPSNIKPLQNRDERVLYATQQAAWAIYGLVLPPIESVMEGLSEAITLQKKAAVSFGETIVAFIPPLSELKELVNSLDYIGGHRLSGNLAANLTQGHDSWQMLVVTSPSANVTINSLGDSKKRFAKTKLAASAISWQQAISAELLGYPVLQENAWLACGDTLPNQADLLSVSVQNGRVIIEQDSADCLIGENFIRPVIYLNGR